MSLPQPIHWPRFDIGGANPDRAIALPVHAGFGTGKQLLFGAAYIQPIRHVALGR